MKKESTPSNTVFPIIKEALNGINEINNQNCSLDDFLDFKLQDNGIRKTLSHLFLSYFRHRQSIYDFLEINLKKSNKSIKEFLSMAISHIKYQTGIAPESSINAWVEYSKKKYSPGFSKLVNAVLRKALNSKELENVSLPKEVEKRWREDFGEAFIQDMNFLYGEYAPFTFRAAVNFELPEDFLLQAEAEKIEVEDNSFQWYQAKNVAEVLRSKYLQDGKIYIQDIATGFAVSLLDKHRKQLQGVKLIDLCGAPGGKVIMASEVFDNKLELTILDKSAKRQKLTAENLKKRNLQASILVADAAKFQSNQKYDIIIADVPCSNSGVFRKRPDALWRLTDKSIADVVEIQKNILDNAVKLCENGALILYSTCSIENSEDRGQVEAFLVRHPDFELLEDKLNLPSHLADGSYAALLKKR